MTAVKTNNYITNLIQKGKICGCLHVNVITITEQIIHYKYFGYKLNNVTLTNRDTKESYTLEDLNKIIYN